VGFLGFFNGETAAGVKISSKNFAIRKNDKSELATVFGDTNYAESGESVTRNPLRFLTVAPKYIQNQPPGPRSSFILT
jgi:hypothetical protein